MSARRRRALALLVLLALWLLGQGAHDPLVHAGEWSHAGGGDHSYCSLFQGLHQIVAEAQTSPVPLLGPLATVAHAAPTAAPSAPSSPWESRGPPQA